MPAAASRRLYPQRQQQSDTQRRSPDGAAALNERHPSPPRQSKRQDLTPGPLPRLGLQDTELERATPGTIRARLLKVGAQIRVRVRRVVVALSEAFPAQEFFMQTARNLAALPARASLG